MDLSVKINRRDGNMAAKRKKYDMVLLLYVGNKVFFSPFGVFHDLSVNIIDEWQKTDDFFSHFVQFNVPFFSDITLNIDPVLYRVKT